MSLTNASTHFNENKEATLAWFIKEIASLRTGRVQPQALEAISVEHYGARTPLNGLASISSLDARTLLISPWDKGAVVAIQKALTEADLGVMPTVDGTVIRLSFPSLTQEIREQTIKQLHKKIEEARVKLRQGRDESMKIIKEAKESSEITEDDFYKEREELDSLIADANKEIEAIGAKKEEDISNI